MRALSVFTIGGVCAALLASPLLAQVPDKAGRAAVVEGYNRTGLRLFQALDQGSGNIVLSPFSAGSAMAMALAGARGETATQMAKVLSLDFPPAEIDRANAALLASLNSASGAVFRLEAANAVMLTRHGDVISDAYLAVLRKDYAAEVFRGADIAAVNGWVRQRTGGKIDAILSRLDPATALVLLDAIYFKAPWRRAFDVKATRYEPFHLRQGEVSVPMMHRRGHYAVARREGYRAIRLPYSGERMSMTVMLPDAGTDEIVRRLDDHELRRLLEAFRAPKEVELSLPRFKAGFAADLVRPLQDMGMRRAFDPRTADFSGMIQPQAEESLAIGEISHRAVIEVTEQGTEAAAATGIGAVITSVRPPPEEFRVDRPFVFAIVDDETGAILFAGRIADPRQAS